MSKSVWFVPILGQSNGVGMKYTNDDGVSGQMELQEHLANSGLFDEAYVSNYALGGSTVDGDHFYNVDTSPNAIWWYPDSNTAGPALLSAIQRIQEDLASFSPADDIHLSVVWMQGEANAESIRKGISDAARYKEGTLETFRYIEQALGVDIDFFLGQTGRYVQREDQTYNSYLTRVAAQNEIQQAQLELAAANSDIHIGAITKDLDMRDEVHLDYESYEIVGDRLAASMIDFFSPDAPALDVIDHLSLTQDADFSYMLDLGDFGMSPVDDVVVTAELANGAPLPSWLVFDADALAFSGIPENEDVGDLNVKITASGVGGAPVSKLIALTIANINDAPLFLDPLPDITGFPEQNLNFQIPTWQILDPDAGDTFMYSASLEDGSPLPNWLTFNAITKSFYGTPSEGDLGKLSIAVTVTDVAGASSTDVFNLDVVEELVNEGVLFTGVVAAKEDVPFSYIIPDSTFADMDLSGNLAITATLPDDAALPAWLHFDAENKRLYGKPAQGDVAQLTVILHAVDDLGESASKNLTLNVLEQNDAPVLDASLVHNFSPIQEDMDAALITGMKVSSVLGNAVSDEDVGALSGIAIIAANQTFGTWQYRLADNVWHNWGAVTSDHALLLDANAVVRFVPAANAHGQADFTFLAWDHTSGAAGSYENTATLAAFNSISLMSATSHIVITGVSDSVAGTLYDDVLVSDDDGDAVYGLFGNDTMYGYAGDDTMYGGIGADSILAGDGDDSVLGEDGADLLYGEAGNDYIYGSKLDDTIYGGAGQDTLVGGSEHDSISGGEGNDTIKGDAGDDTLNGDGGDDSITGSSGNNLLNGGDGNDQLFGSSNNDTLNGDAGNDALNASSGFDLLDGGSGNDTLIGGSDHDTLFGGEGDDSLRGDAGNDFLQGDAGNDSISGYSGLDTILGGDGHDVLNGGGDSDTIMGGLGNDSLIGDTGADSLCGEDGDDSLNGGTNVDTLYGGEGKDLLIGGDNNDFLYGENGNDSLHGDLGNDLLIGGEGDDSLKGSEGEDTLNGDAGNDTINGGTEKDSITGGIGNDSLLGDTGNDTMWGEDGDDTLSGGADFDLLDGGIGNDVINGGAEKDSITGGIGNDSLIGDTGNDTMWGEDGDDTLSGGADFDLLDGGNGNDVINGGTEKDSITGGVGNDSLIGDTGNDTMWGEDGNDTMNGGANADYLIGGAGADIINGGTEQDTIIGGDDNDSLIGDTGDDVIWGDVGDDTLKGGEDHDMLDGGIGSDSINGDAGDDTLWGKDGNDTLNGGAGVDLLSGGLGHDALNGGTDQDTLFGAEGNDTLIGDYGNDILWGEDGNDNLNGGGEADYLDGGIGDDSLSGGDQEDMLIGGADNDNLKAGNGNDTLYGGSGVDALYGEAGADNFVWLFASESGTGTLRDSVRDFSHAAGDKLDFSLFEYDLHFIGNAQFTGAGLEIRYSVGTSTLISIDINGDTAADMELFLVGQIQLEDSDFML